MTLLDKYRVLLEAAKASITEGLQYAEQNGVIIIRGIVPNAELKNKLWDIYHQIDPHFISGEVLLEVDVVSHARGCKACLKPDEPIVNIHKGPGVELPTLGQVQKDAVVDVLCRANGDWWLIRTDNIEGYCYVQHVEIVQ